MMDIEKKRNSVLGLGVMILLLLSTSASAVNVAMGDVSVDLVERIEMEGQGEGKEEMVYKTGSEGLADSEWPTFRGDLENTGLSSVNTSYTYPSVEWRLEVGHVTYSSPSLDEDGNIYISSADTNLYSVSPGGEERWTYSYSTSSYSPATIDRDGTAYFGDNGFEFFAVRSDGSRKWRRDVDGHIRGSPALVDNGTIYIGSCGFVGEGTLYAIDSSSGSDIWTHSVGTSMPTSPAVDEDGGIYVGVSDGNLTHIDPGGSEVWTFQTEDSTGAVPAPSPVIGEDGTVYIGSTANKLYAVNPDGTERWHFETNDSVVSSPALGPDGTIYFGSDDGRIYALDGEGNEKWNFTTEGEVRSSPSLGSEGTIYVGSNDDHLYALNPDGTLKWRFDTGRDVTSSPAIDEDGYIYVVSDGGTLYKLGGEPYFDIETTSIQDGELIPRDGEASIDFSVVNRGDEEAIKPIHFFLNDTEMDSTALRLEAGEKGEASFSWDTEAHQIGEYDITLESEYCTDRTRVRLLHPDPHYDVTIDTPKEGEEFYQGKEVLVNFTVENKGVEGDEQVIELRIDGTLDEKMNLSLEGGASHLGNFTWDTSGIEPENYTVMVRSEDGLSAVTVTVFAPFFEVGLESPAGGDKFVEGEEVFVEYNLTNTGNIEGSQDIEILINGDLESETRDLTLDVEERYRGDLSWNTTSQDPGRYVVEVRSEDSMDKVDIWVLNSTQYFEVNVTSPRDGEEFVKNTELSIDFNLTNLGISEGTQDIELLVDGSVESTMEDISIESTATHSDTFSWSVEKTGKIMLEVRTLDDVDGSKVTILEPSHFEVDITAPSERADLVEGEEVVLEYEVKNTGDLSGTQNISFRVDGEEVEVEVLQLGPGELEKRNFNWTAEDPAHDNNLSVHSEDTFDEIIIRVLKEAKFEIEIVGPKNGDEYVVGDEIEIEYTVNNTGEVEDTKEIEVWVGEELIYTENVTLGAGDVSNSMIIWETEEGYEGEYDIEIKSEDDTDLEGNAFNVVEEPKENGDDGETEDKDEDEDEEGTLRSSFFLYILVAAVVAVVLVLVIVSVSVKKDEDDFSNGEGGYQSSDPPSPSPTSRQRPQSETERVPNERAYEPEPEPGPKPEEEEEVMDRDDRDPPPPPG